MEPVPATAVSSRYTRALERFRGLSRARKALVFGAGAVVAVIILMALRSGGESSQTVAVTRGSVVSMAQVLGKMEPVESVDLSFGESGRVSAVSVMVGDRVARGAVLASLENAELGADLREAQAILLAQQADFLDAESGGRPEEVAIAEADLREAQQDLQTAYDTTYQALSDAYGDAVSALHVQLFPLFDDEGGESSGPQYRLTFDITDYATEAAAIAAREDAEEAMVLWRDRLAAIADGGTPEEYLAATEEAQRHLTKVNAAIHATGAIFTDASSVGVGLEDDTFEDYRTRVNTARTYAAAASRTVSDHRQLLMTSALDVRTAEQELLLKTSGGEQRIAAERARVMSAQARVDRVRALIAKNVIRSPIDGIVTRVDAKVGQTALANTPAVWVISDSALQVDANVPEVDIGEVTVGDNAIFTVDALPGVRFTGAVAAVDPAETVIGGVVNFAVTVAVASADARLRSGMTTDLSIEGERRDDVLVVPLRALIENRDGSFVDLMTDGGTVRTKVEVGLKGADGNVEIISGLSEGDLILVPDAAS